MELKTLFNRLTARLAKLKKGAQHVADWCWEYQIYALALVFGVSLTFVWRFYILHYNTTPPNKGWDTEFWYKVLIENSWFLNILLSSYLIYIAIVWIKYLCSYKEKIWHLFVYAFIIWVLWFVPALEPVKTLIFSMPYHVFVSILLTIVFGTEICLLYLRSQRKSQNSPIKQTSGFIANVPPTEHTKTEWNTYIDTLLNMIGEEQLQEESFTIGITGAWGSGKTTFYETLKNKIEEKKVFSVCEFKPWQVLNNAHLCTAFFVQFKEHLLKFNPALDASIIADITHYAQLLEAIPIVQDYVEPVLKTFQQEKEESIQELHNKIENALIKNSYWVAIMIDDLDRLNREEIMEVLRLVRASANFRNVLFVITYDKKYVAPLIDPRDENNGKEFLKKIVHVEVNLPPIENYKYSDLLCQNICKTAKWLMPSEIAELNMAIQAKNPYSENTLINRYSHNFRDLLRFANQFGLILNYLHTKKILGAYNIQDLFWLEMLHYFHEETYYILQEHPLRLLEKQQNSSNRQTYLVKTVSKGKKEKQAAYDPILRLLYNEQRTDSHKTIIWINNYNNYFAHRFLDNTVSFSAFSLLMQENSSVVVRTQIDEWINKGHAKQSLLQAILNYPHSNVFQTEQDFRNYTRVLLHLSQRDFFALEDLAIIIRTKYQKDFFAKIEQKEQFMALLRRFIERKPGINWNIMLTNLFNLDAKADDDSQTIFTRAQLQELAELNYKLVYGSDVPSFRKIFYDKSGMQSFIASAVCISYEEQEGTIFQPVAVTHYTNLLTDYLWGIYSGRQKTSRGVSDFNNMLKPLEKMISTVQTDESIRIIRAEIEKRFGTLERFSQFLLWNFGNQKFVEAKCKQWKLPLPPKTEDVSFTEILKALANRKEINKTN